MHLLTKQMKDDSQFSPFTEQAQIIISNLSPESEDLITVRNLYFHYFTNQHSNDAKFAIFSMAFDILNPNDS